MTVVTKEVADAVDEGDVSVGAYILADTRDWQVGNNGVAELSVISADFQKRRGNSSAVLVVTSRYKKGLQLSLT